jgi:hypothetical protein
MEDMMSDPIDPAADLLRGAKEIALAIYGKDDQATVRRVYYEQDRWPIFRLDDTGVLFALRSRIAAHTRNQSLALESRLVAGKVRDSQRPMPVKSRRRRRSAA